MNDWRARHHTERSNPRSDARDPFKRDRDRLLYSTALRRLAGVTQVVSPIEGDIVHNRLTHTLKVAQISRRLTERLISSTQADVSGSGRMPDPDVAEAAALAHDLGHPPFGHIGEEELDSLLGGDLGGFEGNAQSLRIVSKLAVRSDEYAGLNLTRATLDGLLKYPWSRLRGKSKWGYYEEESAEFTWIRVLDRRSDVRTVEAEVMDWADDITYAVHDVEDFFRAGLIPLHLIVRDSEERSRFLEATRMRWAHTNPERLENWSTYRDAFIELTGTFPIRSPYTGDRKQQADVHRIGSELITRFINAPTLMPNDDGPELTLLIGPDVKAEVTMLKSLNWAYVIESAALRTQQHGFRQIIRDLFRVFTDPANTDLVPTWLAAEIANDCSIERRASDIICSLSDAQAWRLRQRVMGHSPGSIRDWV